MDYRELLIKYMAHVADQEGATFVPNTREECEAQGWGYSPGNLTDAEVEELDRLIPAALEIEADAN